MKASKEVEELYNKVVVPILGPMLELAKVKARLNQKLWAREYYKKHKARYHQWYLDNKEKKLADSKVYYEKNKKKINARRKLRRKFKQEGEHGKK